MCDVISNERKYCFLWEPNINMKSTMHFVERMCCEEEMRGSKQDEWVAAGGKILDKSQNLKTFGPVCIFWGSETDINMWTQCARLLSLSVTQSSRRTWTGLKERGKTALNFNKTSCQRWLLWEKSHPSKSLVSFQSIVNYSCWAACHFSLSIIQCECFQICQQHQAMAWGWASWSGALNEKILHSLLPVSTGN